MSRDVQNIDLAFSYLRSQSENRVVKGSYDDAMVVNTADVKQSDNKLHVSKENEISRKGVSSNGSLEIQNAVLDSSNDYDNLDPRIDEDIARLDISHEK